MGVIDIEASRGEAAKSALLAAKGASKIICSHHEFYRMPSEDELKQMFWSVAADPAVDVAKLVVMANSFDDSFTIQRHVFGRGGQLLQGAEPHTDSGDTSRHACQG